MIGTLILCALVIGFVVLAVWLGKGPPTNGPSSGPGSGSQNWPGGL